MKIETMVQDEIQSLLEQMNGLDPTSEEYKAAADAVTMLIDRTVKMEELHIKEKEIVEARKDHVWDRILRGVGIALPPTVALIAAFGFSVLERTENVTSTPAREFMKRALRLN
jgi:hypothetical protein